MIANVETTFSATSLAKFLKNEQRTVAPETILNYIKYCCEAYLFYQVKREDLQGKQILASNEKYYIADHGIREAVFGGNMRDINLILENIVYLELLRRGFPKYVVSLDEFDMSRNGEYSCVKNVIPVQWGSSAIIRIVYVSAVWFFSTFQSPLLYSNKNLI